VIVGLAVFVVATVLLVSMGGAIVAAPLTLPVLAVVVRHHPTRGFRIAGAIIGGLTAAEVAWAAVYLVAGEAPVLVWLLPALIGIAAGAVLGRRRLPTAGARLGPSEPDACPVR
jgi:hypothetical protein